MFIVITAAVAEIAGAIIVAMNGILFIIYSNTEVKCKEIN